MIYNQTPEVQTRQDPPLRIEVDNLEKTTIALAERLQFLEERLYSVLQEPCPEKADRLAKDIHGQSAMTRKIYEITNEIGRAVSRVENLIDRLEV